MASLEPLLAARSVTASRPGKGGHLKRVLHETSLEVEQGEVVAIVGPSGSGKSTFLRLFNRLLEPDGGQVMMSGKDIRKIDPPELRSQLPLVVQKPFLFPGTVHYNLVSSARFLGVNPPDTSASEFQKLLSLCHVDMDWLDQEARRLSVGQQQRICLVRALLGPCKAVLLDEPTSALDRLTAEQLSMTFKQLCRDKGLAMIVVTHDLRVAEFCADRIAIMVDGSIIESGEAKRLLREPESDAARQFLATSETEKTEGNS